MAVCLNFGRALGGGSHHGASLIFVVFGRTVCMPRSRNFMQAGQLESQKDANQNWDFHGKMKKNTHNVSHSAAKRNIQNSLLQKKMKSC